MNKFPHKTAMVLAGTAFALNFYAFGIEPYTLKMEHITMRTRLNGTVGTLKAVQFTDVHLGEGGSLMRLQRLVNEIMQQKPDVIFFTGDLIDDPKSYHGSKQAGAILRKLRAPYGKFAVLGNHDYRNGMVKKGIGLLENGGFIFLHNSLGEFITKAGMKVQVIGLADTEYDTPDYSVIPYSEENQVQIVLTHEGDFAQDIAARCPDIILAGHSHGGQIRIPFIGAPVRTKHAKIYERGIYQVGRSILYLDSGVGVSGMRARFLAPPQFTVMQIL